MGIMAMSIGVCLGAFVIFAATVSLRISGKGP